MPTHTRSERAKRVAKNKVSVSDTTKESIGTSFALGGADFMNRVEKLKHPNFKGKDGLTNKERIRLGRHDMLKGNKAKSVPIFGPGPKESKPTLSKVSKPEAVNIAPKVDPTSTVGSVTERINGRNKQAEIVQRAKGTTTDTSFVPATVKSDSAKPKSLPSLDDRRAISFKEYVDLSKDDRRAIVRAEIAKSRAGRHTQDQERELNKTSKERFADKLGPDPFATIAKATGTTVNAMQATADSLSKESLWGDPVTIRSVARDRLLEFNRNRAGDPDSFEFKANARQMEKDLDSILRRALLDRNEKKKKQVK